MTLLFSSTLTNVVFSHKNEYIPDHFALVSKLLVSFAASHSSQDINARLNSLD